MSCMQLQFQTSCTPSCVCVSGLKESNCYFVSTSANKKKKQHGPELQLHLIQTHGPGHRQHCTVSHHSLFVKARVVAGKIRATSRQTMSSVEGPQTVNRRPEISSNVKDWTATLLRCSLEKTHSKRFVATGSRYCYRPAIDIRESDTV